MVAVQTVYLLQAYRGRALEVYKTTAKQARQSLYPHRDKRKTAERDEKR
jgi:hypothetical protein